MSLDIYEAFVQVVEQGSVSAAARVLGVPRPTVSRRIARLEERLGERLVRRGAREVTVTRVGQTLYERVRGPLGQLAAAEREVIDQTDAPRGLLRVAVPPALTPSLGPLWAQLQDTYPQVEVEVHSETRFVELTGEGFDVALRGGRSSNPDLVQRKLMTTRAGLWATAPYLERFGTPQSVSALSSHRLLRGYTSRNEPQRRWPLLDGGSFPVAGTFSSNDTTQLRAACAQGMGIALLSEIPPPPEALIPLLPEVGLRLDLHVIYPERALLPPRVRAFIDLAVPFFQEWASRGGRRLGALVLGMLLLGGCSPAPAPPPTAVQSAASLPDAQVTALMYGLLPGRLPGAQAATVAAITASPDPRLAAPVIDLLRFSDDIPWAPPLLTTITGQDHGMDWHAWVEWASAAPPQLPPGYAGWKGELFAVIVDSPRFAAMLPRGVPRRIRLDEVVWGGVAVDGIPALDRAPQIAAANATWLDENEFVVGVSVGTDHRAYPLRILGAHEMANDVVGGVPVSLSYCTLCGSAVLYSSRVGDAVYDFGSSGLLMRSNKLMYDRQTQSLWNQMTGEPVVGPLADSGVVLERRPTVVSTWGEWRGLHPDTTVLSQETGHNRTYERTPYASYNADEGLMFPVARRSQRLPAKERVFAAVVDGTAKAWPLAALSREVRVDTVGDVSVLLVPGGDVEATTQPAGRSVRMFRWDGSKAQRGTEPWTVQAGEHRWRVTEDGLVGPGGAVRERLPGQLAFWFGWFAFFPETEIGE